MPRKRPIKGYIVGRIGKILAAIALGIIIVMMGTVVAGYWASPAHADTNRPDMGKVLGFECGGNTGSNGFIPFLAASWLSMTQKSTVLRITTDNRWEPLTARGVHVWVNNIPQSPLLDTTAVGRNGLEQGLYYIIPALGTTPGQAPTVGITVSNREGQETISFSQSWSLDDEFELLASGRIIDTECVVTSNPRP